LRGNGFYERGEGKEVLRGSEWFNHPS